MVSIRARLKRPRSRDIMPEYAVGVGIHPSKTAKAKPQHSHFLPHGGDELPQFEMLSMGRT